MTLPAWVGLLTGSPQHVAGVAAVDALPALALGPFAGLLADRWNPRATLVACDVMRAAALLGLLLVPHAALLPALYVVGFLVACATTLFTPARAVALQTLVALDKTVAAQALTRATQSAALVLGPPLGAGLLLRFGPGVGLLVDAASFAIGAIALLLVRFPPRLMLPRISTRPMPGHALIADLRAGLAVVARARHLRLLLLMIGIVHLVGNLWFAVDPFFVEQSLGMPKESAGALWAASGTGGLVGSILVATQARRARPQWLLLVGLGLKGSALLWYSTQTSFAWAALAACASGFGAALIAVAASSLLLRWTPPAAVGRVTALSETANQLLTIGALGALGLLDPWLAPSQILLLCGGLLCATCISAGMSLARSGQGRS